MNTPLKLFGFALLLSATLAAGCKPEQQTPHDKPDHNTTTTQTPTQPTTQTPIPTQTPFNNTLWDDALIQSLPSQGDNAAPYQLLVFLDPEANDDRTLLRELDSLRASLPENRLQIRVGFYPMNTACNPQVSRNRSTGACIIARSLLCAHEQNQFWPLLNEMRAALNAKAAEGLPYAEGDAEEALAKASNAKADLNLWRACLSAPRTNANLAVISARASALGVGGTPAWLVNGHTPPFPMLSPFHKIHQWITQLPPKTASTNPPP